MIVQSGRLGGLQMVETTIEEEGLPPLTAISLKISSMGSNAVGYCR